MTSDTVISWLIHSDWFLLASWIVLLGGAFGITLSESRAPADSTAERDTSPGL